MSATNGANIRKTDGSSLEFFSSQFGIFSKVPQPLELILDLKETDVVDIFDVRDDQAVGRVDGDTDIVAGVDAVLEGVDFGVVKRVHLGELFESQRKGLDEDAHYGDLLVVFLQGLSHPLYLSDVELLMKVQVGNGVAFSHRFLHALFVAVH